MLELFPDCPDAVSRSEDIAARCYVDIEFGVIKLPRFDVPGQKDNYAWFRALCYDGFARRYGNDAPQKYLDRLEYELQVIHTMGYVDYYLIVHDFIRRAKEMGIPVGPGRGSGAGSIAAYVIGITRYRPDEIQSAV
jgi:DNA polymerase-3 subunit alpha